MSAISHLAACPEGFEDFADMILVVNGHRLPAHSQILASHSKLIQSLLRDCPTFNKDQPLILDQQLQHLEQRDVQTFLDHTYNRREISSNADAQALLKVADCFESGQLMTKSLDYLFTADDLFADQHSILDWLQLAERLNILDFVTKCAGYAAIHFDQVCKDARYLHLGNASLRAIATQLHLLTKLHPELKERKPEYSNMARLQSKTRCQPNNSPPSVQLGYTCKTAGCNGHAGTWLWHLEKQTWQLRGNEAVSVKILPRTSLELSSLVDIPICSAANASEGVSLGW